jgi:hypothetical protein
MEGTKNVEALIEILKKNTAELERAQDKGVAAIILKLTSTARALGNVPDEKAVEPLVEAMKVIDKRLKLEKKWIAKWAGYERMWDTKSAGQAVVHALGKIGGRLAEKSLTDMLTINNLEIRLTIARELAKTVSDETISELIKAGLHVEDNKTTGELTLPVLAENLEGTPIGIRRITIKKQCVWCEYLSDPEFRDPRYPRGGGYCKREQHGPTNLDSTCTDFTPDSRGAWWLNTNYMRSKYPLVRVWWRTVN